MSSTSTLSDAPLAAAPKDAAAVNRTFVVLSIMTATVMSSLDSTIANVALPHIQGSVSASADQITWVLTSYIVAAAIMTPMTGWLAGRFGRKRVFLISVVGFTFASALCGLAQSLVQIVGFRLFQGVCGAALIPLSQAVLLDAYPRERHGQAMAIWGMGAMLGPIMGPALGGWLTDNYSWRWVFYINLPFGVMAATGIWLFIKDVKDASAPRLDFMGFLALALGIGALQMLMDRGQQKDWFGSREIWVEATLAFLGFYWTVVQTATAKKPFISRALMTDRNFVVATIFGFFIGILLFATMALLPPMLEDLIGYPVVTTGLLMVPRGVGTFISMFIVGRLIGKVETRLILFVGLCLTALALWGMSSMTLIMGPGLVIMSGVLQGLGIGLIFVPLSTLAFATIDVSLRSEAAGVYTLVRNIGSSVGISIMEALLVQNSDVVHADLIRHVRPDNPNLVNIYGAGGGFGDLHSLALMNAQVGQQSAMVAYIDDYKLMMLMALGAMPLLLILQTPKRAPAANEIHAVE